MKIALGCDHGGYELKEHIKGVLEKLGHTYEDFGCHSKESCDYPDFGAAAVSEGSDSQAGLTLADIAPRVDRIYAVTTEDQISVLSQAVSAASAETEFVPELAAAPAAFTGSWLVTG